MFLEVGTWFNESAFFKRVLEPWLPRFGCGVVVIENPPRPEIVCLGEREGKTSFGDRRNSDSGFGDIGLGLREEWHRFNSDGSLFLLHFGKKRTGAKNILFRVISSRVKQNSISA